AGFFGRKRRVMLVCRPDSPCSTFDAVYGILGGARVILNDCLKLLPPHGRVAEICGRMRVKITARPPISTIEFDQAAKLFYHDPQHHLRALVDAGIMQLRPVMITVGATVLALFPLALHGGPLWKPSCYSQIGGLGVATFITLLLVPVLCATFVLDLKWVKWEGPKESNQEKTA